MPNNDKTKELIGLLSEYLTKPTNVNNTKVVNYIKSLSTTIDATLNNKCVQAANSMRSFLKKADDNNLEEVIGGLKSIFPDHDNKSKLDNDVKNVLDSILAAHKADLVAHKADKLQT